MDADSCGDVLQGMSASEDVAQRAEEVDAFCRSLRPGPLQEIVGKQVTRLHEAAQYLRSPSSRLTAELVSIGVEKYVLAMDANVGLVPHLLLCTDHVRDLCLFV